MRTAGSVLILLGLVVLGFFLGKIVDKFVDRDDDMELP